jgi:hypothetical protein
MRAVPVGNVGPSSREVGWILRGKAAEADRPGLCARLAGDTI